MTNRMNELLVFFVFQKKHHAFRKQPQAVYQMAEKWQAEGLSDVQRAKERTLYMLDQETPVLFPLERIALTRVNPTVVSLFTQEEEEQLKKTVTLHEKGEVCNISMDYSKLLDCGLEKRVDMLAKQETVFASQGKTEEAEYLKAQQEILQAVMAFCDRYLAAAKEQNKEEVVALLSQVPRHAPATFPQALQMLRILHYVAWISGSYHNTLGRVDQYLYSYYQKDIENKALTNEEALEWVEEFFLSCNRDSDLYVGMQQGDNGQSMVLGGLNVDGTDSYNALSTICLEASLHLKLIDPKINLRVNRHTSLETYRLGSELTKQGLGFPQYSNDEVVIPALIRMGYSEEDTHNYVVAACWEFIIPGKGMDIPNINAISFATAMQSSVEKYLLESNTFEDLMKKVKEDIASQVQSCMEDSKNVYIFPSPYVSLLMDRCSEQGKDISLGGVYNNYGFHGTGVATAADALIAIRKLVYEEKEISKEALLEALHTNFENAQDLQARLRFDMPKMGTNNDEVDQIAVILTNHFADCMENKTNDRGGIFRAGTGSAMYYVWHANELPATADGRKQGENLACNYSPSLFARINSPISILQSFAKPNLQRICNGGPLTLELHDSLFRNEEAVMKVGQMVKSFMDLGGHQLQLNAVNRETMLDAQQNPDKYQQLIVRVWGWSGYFIELDKEYQDHIISRMELDL